MYKLSLKVLLAAFLLIFGANVGGATENESPSLNKLIDQIDDIVGGGLDPESFEEKCSFDPNECNLKQLCEIATTGDDGSKSWNLKAEGYVELAREYGLVCGVETEKIETQAIFCSSETADQCSAKELCSWASSGGEWRLTASLQLSPSFLKCQ